jgi:hypothetical protein
MFFNVENPSERHPNAYNRLLEHMQMFNSIDFKKFMVPNKLPFNIREPIGFRHLPGQEPKDYKTHKLTNE